MLGSLRLFAGRITSSVSVLEIALIVAGAWVVWRVFDRLVGRRTG